MTKSSIVRIRSAQAEVERDPITRFQLFLVREGILDEKGIDELEKDVDGGSAGGQRPRS